VLDEVALIQAPTAHERRSTTAVIVFHPPPPLQTMPILGRLYAHLQPRRVLPIIHCLQWQAPGHQQFTSATRTSFRVSFLFFSRQGSILGCLPMRPSMVMLVVVGAVVLVVVVVGVGVGAAEDGGLALHCSTTAGVSSCAPQ
jgi:hypothetical protein